MPIQFPRRNSNKRVGPVQPASPPSTYLLTGKETKVQSTCSDKAEESSHGVSWIRQQPGSDGNIFLSVGRSGTRFLVRYANLAEFTVDVEQQTIAWRPLRRLDHENRENAIRLGKNQVIPMLLSMGDRLVLHASAVVLPTRSCVAFSAPSGFGKSTLAECLGATPNTHYADDWIAIDATSSSLTAFTYDDGIETIIAPERFPFLPTQEVRFGLSEIAHYQKQAIPLKEIFIIGTPNTTGSIKLKQIEAKGKFVSLTKNLFRLDSSAPAQLRKELALTTELITRVPVTELNYPRNKQLLPELVKQVQVHSLGKS